MGSGPASPSPGTAFSVPRPFISPSPASQRPSSSAPPTSSSCLQAPPRTGYQGHCIAFVAAVLYATEAFCIISSLEAWSGSSQPSQACSGGQRTMLIGSSSPSSAAPSSISISQPYVRGCVLHVLLPGRSCELHSEAV